MSKENKSMLSDLQKEVKAFEDQAKGKLLARFFKTGKGEYAQGDLFYGLTVPQSRIIASKYKDLSISDCKKLLQSPIHEERLISLLILIQKFQNADDAVKKQIYDLYLSQTKYINNWDLVDLSADKIVGEYLKDRDRTILKQLAYSNSLWERRISIIATFQFIKDNKEYTDTFEIADILLHDKQDLIQKAVGWMLREVGKRISQEIEEEYLKTRYQTMPRTALRYAIERFHEEKRKQYLVNKI